METKNTEYATFRAWIEGELKEMLPDIVNHGANCGFPGITMYSETVELYNKYNSEIWEALWDDAESYGNKNILEFISTFNGAKDISDDDTLKNLLVWYFVERTARELTEKDEDDN